MDYIQEWQQKLNQQKQGRNLEALADEKIWGLRHTITNLQELQLLQRKGSDDKTLHSNFNSGFYTEATEEIAGKAGLHKPAGSPYNFKWTDRFVQQLSIGKKQKNWRIISGGIQGPDKIDFFEGYTNMFGLDSQNTATILSEVEDYVLGKILSKIYV